MSLLCHDNCSSEYQSRKRMKLKAIQRESKGRNYMQNTSIKTERYILEKTSQSSTLNYQKV